MAENSPTSVPPTLPPATPPPRKGRWVLYGCGGLLALLLIIAATVAITIWWIQRPIKPVVLTAKEKAVAEEKLRLAQGSGAGKNSSHTQPEAKEPKKIQEPDRVYTPGSKQIRLTEREVNGLLNENTDLGKTVRFEFGRDAVNAYIVVPIPQDFPIGGGRTFRARGRFGLSIGSGGQPYASLEDVTVLGLSLPKAWLGGIKGENLLSDAAGGKNGKPVLSGIKSLHVEPGALVLEVED